MVLLGSSVALLAGCTSDPDPPAAPPSSPDPTRAQEATIFDLSLQEHDRFRPFELVAAGFEADAGKTPVAPFASVEVRLAPDTGAVSAGLVAEDGDHVLVRWSAKSSQVRISVRRDGHTRILRRRAVTSDGLVAIAFALCENQVTALVDTGEGWRPVLTERTKVAALVDLRRAEELGRFGYAWDGDGVEGRAGLFGMTGLRDPHVVQHADGTPYERDGRLYLTWTCAGLGFFQQAHWTVWSLDPAARRHAAGGPAVLPPRRAGAGRPRRPARPRRRAVAGGRPARGATSRPGSSTSATP